MSLNIPSSMSIKEAFTVNSSKGTEYGIEGYFLPTTPQYFSTEHKIPTGKKKDIYYEIERRSHEPDSTTYCETPAQSFKRHWVKSNGKFSQGPRESMIDEMVKLSESNPGPGSYLKQENSSSKLSMGRFAKEEGSNFISSAIVHSEELPEEGDYKPNTASVTKRSPEWGFGKPNTPVKREKSQLGPGSYFDGSQKGYQKIMKTSCSFSVEKSKAPNAIGQKAHESKFVPGVGAYKDVDKAYVKNIVEKRGRMATIFSSKNDRMIDRLVREKDWVPGPGSYNIGPPKGRI